jgi:hypothetical protein
MPKNLTEALAAARAKRNNQDTTAPKQMAEVFIDRKQELDFRTDKYHAAPMTEMY